MARSKTRKAAQKRGGSFPLWTVVAGVVALAVVVFAVWQLSSPPTASTGAASADAPPLEISVAQAAALRDEGAFVLDVREPSEWNELHVPDSVHIPLGDLTSRLSEVPTDQQVVVICRSGNRSAQARDLLLDAGYTTVTSVAGGINDWRAQGQPTVSGP